MKCRLEADCQNEPVYLITYYGRSLPCCKAHMQGLNPKRIIAMLVSRLHWRRVTRGTL